MNRWIWATAAAAVFAFALPASVAEAGAVMEATVKDGYVNAGGKLKGNWTAEITGDVGSNVAQLDGSFSVTGGKWKNWFGGYGAVTSISSTLTNFESTVTGTTGINTQAAFGGDLFAEAATYAASASSWAPTEYIKFSFDELYIQGLNGAYLAAGRNSTSSPMGKIYNYNGNVLVNFWMDRLTFNSSSGKQTVLSTGDWITVVLDHSVSGGNEPVPEPSTWAMMAIGAAGIGFWMQRRRRGSPAAAVA